jgi:hypothetical protein
MRTALPETDDSTPKCYTAHAAVSTLRFRPLVAITTDLPFFSDCARPIWLFLLCYRLSSLGRRPELDPSVPKCTRSI